MRLTSKAISLLRLKNQQVGSNVLRSAEEVVAWMGAMQAQDYGMVRWAVGVRQPGLSMADVQDAIDRGQIIRTHVLRPTWHLVSSRDVSWMLDLTAPYIKASMQRRLRELELTSTFIRKGYDLIARELTAAPFLTREEIAAKFSDKKLDVQGQRIAHLLLLAELDKLICSGPLKGKKNTYALFSKRIKGSPALSHDEALAALCARYFQSHGPATLRDFAWWSGLPAREARSALDMSAKTLQSETVNDTDYWFADGTPRTRARTSLYLLPAFDEFIISYNDRTDSLEAAHHMSAIASNGLFRPVVVYNGQVIGLWKKTSAQKGPVIDVKFLPKAKVPKSDAFKKLLKTATRKVTEFYSISGSGAPSARFARASSQYRSLNTDY